MEEALVQLNDLAKSQVLARCFVEPPRSLNELRIHDVVSSLVF